MNHAGVQFPRSLPNTRMNINKLTDAYCYLKLKEAYRFETFALKILWKADYDHLRKYGRTVSGCSLPITELPELEIEYCSCGLAHRKGSDTHVFGELSLADMMSLDFAFAEIHVTEETSDETDDLHVRVFSSLEEVFEGMDVEYAQEMIQEIREHEALEQFLLASGLLSGTSVQE